MTSVLLVYIIWPCVLEFVSVVGCMLGSVVKSVSQLGTVVLHTDKYGIILELYCCLYSHAYSCDLLVLDGVVSDVLVI